MMSSTQTMGDQMLAMVYEQYGGPEQLTLKDVPMPEPKDDEVLIKVKSASLNAADKHLLRGEIIFIRLDGGLRTPKNPILGADASGVVTACGKNVTRFETGDAVMGDLSGDGFGGFAEYVCAKETTLSKKPSEMSFDTAASLPMASVTALQALRDLGGLKPGQSVLINGASGGVGTFALQLAREFGATQIAVTSSAAKHDGLRALGASECFDYKVTSVADIKKKFDLIFAANGDTSCFKYRKALQAKGRCVVGGGSMKQIFQALLLGPLLSIGSKSMKVVTAKPNADDLSFVADLVQAQKVVPVIDRQFALADLKSAMEYFFEGHAKGKVLINVA